ncbi:MAG TPA: hypothetical protein VIY48_01585 [Candidatus Paceibacterota bacterium]
MWSYGNGWGQGYIQPEPNNYVSYPSTYGGVDPAYSGNSGGSGIGAGSLWGTALSAVGGYLDSRAQADAAANQAKLSAQAQLELQKQQREYDLQDRQYRKDSVGKWSRYFS